MAPRIKGDAIEHRIAVLRADFGNDGATIDHMRHHPGRGINGDNIGRLPHIGEQAPIDPFQLVELRHGLAARCHLDAAHDVEADRIAKDDGVASVRHGQLIAHRRQPPALTRVA